MAGEHPSDVTLLEYVEGELGEGERREVETHLASCDACTADLTLATSGRDAIRSAPEVAPPAGLAAGVLDEIAPRPSPRVAAGRRWLSLAAPVAAAVAVAAGIAIVVVLEPGGGGGDDESAAIAEGGAGDTGSGEGGGEALEGTDSSSAALGRVAAEPEELAADLRRAGFQARVEDGVVYVDTDRPARLRRVLAEYPRGGLPVVVE